MQIRTKFIVAVCSLFLTMTAGGQSATGVSAGDFGATTGGGNYSFPARLTVGTTDTIDPLLGFSKFQVADGTSKLSFRDHASGNPWLLLSNATMKGIFHLNVAEGVVMGSVTPHNFALRTNNLNRLTIDAAGNVAIGSPTPGAFYRTTEGGVDQPVVLGVTSANGARIGFVAPNASNGDLYFAHRNSASHPVATSLIRGAIGVTTAGQETGALLLYTKPAGGTVAEAMRVDAFGNVGIGTTTPTKRLDVNGDINVSGNINAKYQDLAEWVPVVSPMEPGTVVIVSAGKRNEVMPSARAYDTAVAGVVSAQPGITLGEPGDDKAKIATTGRVRVHVDASRGAIRAGDLLVTSDKPGTAMRSEPMAIGEYRLHRPGTVIGKALEPLASGEGDILVLLSMQ